MIDIMDCYSYYICNRWWEFMVYSWIINGIYTYCIYHGVLTTLKDSFNVVAHDNYTTILYVLYIPERGTIFRLVNQRNYGQSPVLMRKSTMSMAIFNSKLQQITRGSLQWLYIYIFLFIITTKSWTTIIIPTIHRCATKY